VAPFKEADEYSSIRFFNRSNSRNNYRPLSVMGRIIKLEEIMGIGGVLVHGCFDLLHLGHLRYLAWARTLGHPLTVTLTADKYFPDKGPNRPAFNQNERAEWLTYIEGVDNVSIVHEPTGVAAIFAIRPEIYCKGERVILPVEEHSVAMVGGRVEYSPFGHSYSSTEILGRGNHG